MRTMLIICSLLAGLIAFGTALADDEAPNTWKTRCQGCHGPDGGRAPAAGIEPVKGQSAAEIKKKLNGYKDGSFGGPARQVMQGVAKGLSSAQIDNLSDYAAKL